MARKRGSGHYCWACDRMRANEKFSGNGHARHLCKDCARLGGEELAYRQAIRDLERLATGEGICCDAHSSSRMMRKPTLKTF
jgi:hypothetical protein